MGFFGFNFFNKQYFVYKNFGVDWIINEDLSILYRDVSAIRIVVDIKANAKANMKLTPIDLYGKEIITPTKEQEKIINLIKKPNPIHSTWEFIKLSETFKEIWGRSFVYANMPNNREKMDAIAVNSLIPIPSAHMYPQYSGTVFSATNINDIIKYYIFNYNGIKEKFNTNKILDRSDTNICFYDQFINNQYNVNSYSKINSIKPEITNYIKALEGRNVTIRKLGARGIFSSGKKDSIGAYPLTDKERKDSQDRLNEYGAMADQNQYIVVSTPLTYQNIAFSPRELMLLEENWHTMIAIANTFGVPPDLVKLYIQGDSDNKSREVYKRLYEQTIIPESKDIAGDLSGFLNTEKYGMKFKATFDHLDILQEDKKDKSIKDRNINIAHRDMFKSGAITYNQWLTAMDLPEDKIDGNKKIWDLTDTQRAAIIGVINQDIPKK